MHRRRKNEDWRISNRGLNGSRRHFRTSDADYGVQKSSLTVKEIWDEWEPECPIKTNVRFVDGG